MSCCSSLATFGKDYCNLQVVNASGKTMMFKGVTYIRGAAISPGWPTGINSEDRAIVQSAGVLTGVSGYATYELDSTDITIAFSSPSVGTNKLNVGCSGKQVWDRMDSKDYKPWAKRITTQGGTTLNISLKCSSGPVNNAIVELFYAT